MLNYLGIISVGGISVATGGKTEAISENEEAARALGRKLADAIANGFSDPVQEAILADDRAYFRAIVEENRDLRRRSISAG